MNKNSYDVVVVGGGPAGAVAAQRLSLAGVKTALLDQASFPRDKTCGDGVTGEGLRVIERTGLGEWAAGFQTYTDVRLTSPNRQILDQHVIVPPGECYGRTIPRRLLDEKLVQAAVKAGAHLMEKTRVIDITPGAQSVLVKAAGLDLQAKLVILAEGSHALLSRRLGLAAGMPEMVAVQQYLVGDSGPAGRLEVHFQQAVAPGYNWLFPLGGGRVNIGTFTLASLTQKGKVDMKAELQRFISDPINAGRLQAAEAANQVKGAPLRTQIAARCHTLRVLAVGDAVGLVNPLSGEGIAHALVSAEMAVQAALQALRAGKFDAQTLAPYTAAVQRRFAADFRAARFLRTLLSRPGLTDMLFGRLRGKPEMVAQLGMVVIGKDSPQLLLQPRALLKMLF